MSKKKMAQVINLYGPTKEKEGPGVWWTLRMLAENRNECFPAVVAAVVNNFFCGECKEHAKQFLRSNPIPRDAHNWFAWMVKWQNYVNQSQGKHIYTLEQAMAVMHANEHQNSVASPAPYSQSSTGRNYRQPVNIVGCDDCVAEKNQNFKLKTMNPPKTQEVYLPHLQ